MKNKKFIMVTLIIGILFVSNIAVMFLQTWDVSNILEPIGYFVFAGIIFCAAEEAKKIWNEKNVIFFAIASFAFAIGKMIIPLTKEFFKTYPDINWVLSIVLAIPVLMIGMGTFRFAMRAYEKWNALQLLVDAIALSVTALYLYWVLFFDRTETVNALKNTQDIIQAVVTLISVATGTGIVLWIFTFQHSKIQTYIKVAMAGLALYVLGNSYLFYLYFHGQAGHFIFADACFIGAYSLMALSANMFMNLPKGTEGKNIKMKKGGHIYNCLALAIVPIAAAFYKGFYLGDMVVFLILIVLTLAFNIQIKGAIKNEELLEKEKEMNQQLELSVRQRTLELIEKNEKLDKISSEDTVTHLFNRRYFTNKLNEMFNNIEFGKQLAVIFMDIDRFKIINDTYGHYIGNKLLHGVAARIQECKPESAVSARLGGDEFVVAIKRKCSYTDAEKLARRIVEACNMPFVIENYTFNITISAGISIYPFDARDPDSLMRHADIAMYHAKKTGLNKFISFNNELRNTTRRRNLIELHLKNADYDREFSLRYQPQFSLPGGSLIGMEALLHWKNPELGEVSPAEFIPVAEETEAIIPIGNWVMKNAVSQIAEWNKHYHKELKIGVNVSPKHLHQADFLFTLEFLIDLHRIPPKCIDIEITEGVSLQGELYILETVKRLRKIGVLVSIDDFGTGCACLNYLKMIPFNRLKISKSLIENITTDKFDQNIVRTISALSDAMDVQTVADGVELKEQFEVIKTLGCRQVQGSYLGAPVAAGEFETLYLKREPPITAEIAGKPGKKEALTPKAAPLGNSLDF